jgi:putative phage-type endonuclease
MAKRVLKYGDALESYLNHLIRDCNITSNELKDPSTIKNLSKMLEITLKELYNPSEFYKSKVDFSEVVKESLKNRFFYDPPKYSNIDLDRIDNNFKILNSHHKHAQRSPEWYQFRWERLTASDLGKAVGDKGEKSRWDLVYQKSMSLERYIRQRESTSLSGAAIQHGICFEAVATELYELKNNLKVIEYGCLPHLYIDFLAASPDGICDSRETNPDYHGRMLEIKCPYSRVITGIPKTEYYMQVQLQLEVCDLEYCDFLECDIRVYSGMTHFLNDSPPGEVSYKYTISGKKKGVIYEYREKGSNSFKYKYCPLTLSNDEISQWIQDTKSEIQNNISYHSGGCKYWWIEEFNATLIKREQAYFDNMKTKLNDFWNLVVYYRKNGVEELEIKLGLKQRPQTTLENILLKNEDNEFMSYIEIDTEINNNDFNNIDFIDINVTNENNKLDIDEEYVPVILNDDKKISKKSKSKINNDNLEFLDLENNDEEKKEVEVIKPSIKFKKNIMVIKPDDE